MGRRQHEQPGPIFAQGPETHELSLGSVINRTGVTDHRQFGWRGGFLLLSVPEFDRLLPFGKTQFPIYQNMPLPILKFRYYSGRWPSEAEREKLLELSGVAII